MDKQKLVGIYVRVSTLDRQDTKVQEEELRMLAEKRGWRIFRVYSDKGQSGAKATRPALEELWRDCRNGKVDIVCVWSLDRFARSLKQLIEALEEFKRLGVDFVSSKQEFDTTSSAGRLLFHVVGAVAEFERDLIRERVKAGMQKAQRDGKRIGRPSLRQFNEEDILRIRTSRRREKASIRQIALRFGTTQWTVNRILARAS
jgi:DNA invertase Pin-like site-specific DNA recombinase